jgi:hypothetical protein
MKPPELSRRLVACKHFRWMPGMKCDYYVDRHGGFIHSQRCLWKGLPVMEHLDHWPDLTDPATLGCLLHLVREAWGDHRAAVTYCDEGWRFEVWNSDNFFPDWPLGKCFPTEAEALVAALEAAP